MSADNYALIGIHPLAGRGLLPDTAHGIYVGFMSNDYRPSEIPELSKVFHTHEAAVAYADELETEYGESFLCDCTTEDEPAPTPKKTVRQVIQEYSDILNVVYEARTAGDFTWKGLLHEFLEEVSDLELDE